LKEHARHEAKERQETEKKIKGLVDAVRIVMFSIDGKARDLIGVVCPLILGKSGNTPVSHYLSATVQLTKDAFVQA